jgi:hypothetical protein
MDATVVGARFERERVVLGGQHFKCCTFIGCELVVDGRPMSLADCRFECCRFSFEGAARTTLDLLAMLCRDDPQTAAQVLRRLGLATRLDG